MKLRLSFALVSALAVVMFGCSSAQTQTAKPSNSAPKAADSAAKSAQPTAPAAAETPAPVPPKAEVKADAKPASVPESKTEPKSEPKAETPAPAATEPKAEAKVEPKAEPKTEAKAEPKGAGAEVVAVVDGENVTRADLDAFVTKVTGGRPIPAAQKAIADSQILNMLIDQKLLRKFIEAQKIEVDPDALFEAKLRTYLMKMSSGGPKTDADALALANSIRKDLVAGGDFAALAMKNSACPSKAKGGDLGEFSVDRMVPAFSEAVKGLKIDEISQPVKTEYGYHIIQRLALAEGSPKDNLHARHILVKVENAEGQEAMQDNFQKLVGELHGKAKIENKLPAPPPQAGMPGMLPGDEE